jgi:hypothetical protein
MNLTTSKIIPAIVSVLFNYMLYAYLDRLEHIGCDCSMPIHRDITKMSIIVNYIVIFGFLYLGNVPKITTVLISIYNVVMAVTTFIYLRRLKHNKCKCSDHFIRDVYYYYYFITFLIQLVLISMLIMIFIAKFSYRAFSV